MIHDLKSRTVLITGGTGSFGKKFVSLLLTETDVRMVRIYSRDEHKQEDMRRLYKDDERISFYIGDIRDKARLIRALEGADWVVHAAALKQAPLGEIEGQEFVKTNVLGSINVIEASYEAKIDRCLLISTDKAVFPLNLYGATKMIAEKLFLQANRGYGTKYACTRYGNVASSRSTIVPRFLEIKEGEKVPITNPNATRFWIELKEANIFVLNSLINMCGGEIFIPKIKSIVVSEVAKAICPNNIVDIIGDRPGDKVHEILISPYEAYREGENGFIVTGPKYTGYTYSSDKNDFLSVEEIRKYVDGIKNVTC